MKRVVKIGRRKGIDLFWLYVLYYVYYKNEKNEFFLLNFPSSLSKGKEYKSTNELERIYFFFTIRKTERKMTKRKKEKE